MNHETTRVLSLDDRLAEALFEQRTILLGEPLEDHNTCWCSPPPTRRPTSAS